jgi:hypothetical protein
MLRRSAILVLCCASVTHVALDLVYRPWAWSVSVCDLHFANSFTNMTSVVIISALMVLAEGRILFRDNYGKWLIVIAPVAGMIAYEFMQPLLPFGRFDLWDIAWTFAGGISALLVKTFVYDPRGMHQPDSSLSHQESS